MRCVACSTRWNTSPWTQSLRVGPADRRAERVPGESRRHLGDALIAGLAWRLGATIVTRNPRDFEAYGVPVLGYGTD